MHNHSIVLGSQLFNIDINTHCQGFSQINCEARICSKSVAVLTNLLCLRWLTRWYIILVPRSPSKSPVHIALSIRLPWYVCHWNKKKCDNGSLCLGPFESLKDASWFTIIIKKRELCIGSQNYIHKSTLFTLCACCKKLTCKELPLENFNFIVGRLDIDILFLPNNAINHLTISLAISTNSKSSHFYFPPLYVTSSTGQC